MKILVYGAGVLGSLFAAKLAKAGEDVTILARGERLEQIQQHGIVLARLPDNNLSVTNVKTTSTLAPEDSYDLVIVFVRRDQLDSVLPFLAINHGTPNVLFMVNNAGGPDVLINALGKERVLLGFPGASGVRGKFIVRYQLVPGGLQPTTIGELDGHITPRLVKIVRILRNAGFDVATCNHMDAWLKTHVALVSPIANAIYLAGGSTARLSKTQDGLVLMIRAIREGIQVLRKLGYPIHPWYAWLAILCPEPILVLLFHFAMATRSADILLANHANAARIEMLVLANEFRNLARQSNIPTPAMDELRTYIDPNNPVVVEGSASMKLHWRGMTILGISLFSGLLGVAMLTGKKHRK
ncbi:MAG: 2-dehydropantoate 2-reductase N-terminal domain-containing protein [Anaerolineaceae bacterium]